MCLALQDDLHQLRSTTSFKSKLATNKNTAALQCQVRLFRKEENEIDGEIARLKAQVRRAITLC
eukprot:SAG11_NODE_8865_length_968_cov_1.399310_2_plen_64_part_00